MVWLLTILPYFSVYCQLENRWVRQTYFRSLAEEICPISSVMSLSCGQCGHQQIDFKEHIQPPLIARAKCHQRPRTWSLSGLHLKLWARHNSYDSIQWDQPITNLPEPILPVLSWLRTIPPSLSKKAPNTHQTRAVRAGDTPFPIRIPIFSLH